MTTPPTPDCWSTVLAMRSGRSVVVLWLAFAACAGDEQVGEAEELGAAVLEGARACSGVGLFQVEDCASAAVENGDEDWDMCFPPLGLLTYTGVVRPPDVFFAWTTCVELHCKLVGVRAESVGDEPLAAELACVEAELGLDDPIASSNTERCDDLLRVCTDPHVYQFQSP